MSYELPGNAKVWDDHIDQARQVLDSRPVGHPGRALATGYLADSLKTCYQRTSDLDLLNEAISLERETLDLCSKGDPARATSCRHLAESLRMCYQRIGDSHLLTEAVDLAREALNLCSDDHLDWALLCVGLSISLQMSYQRNGHLLLLNEAIDLAREALAVCPYEHLHRAVSCENLASALILRYEHTGESSLPMEAIDLAREAYDLSHPKDSHYAMYCISLSHSLKMLHKLTDDDDLVLEAIELGRQAMVVVHSGHLDRAACCEDLSDSLVLRYKQTNDNILLEEAIDLARESLALRSEGHTDRAMSCGQLADSLRIRLQRTGDGQTLDDAMILAREALALRPEGYPDHAMFCRYLAGLLSVQQKLTKDETIIGEIFSLSKDALAHAPPHTAWVHACSLAWVHLQTISPFYDLNQAIFYLGQSLDHEFDHPSIAVAAVLTGLEDLWDHNLEEKHVALTVVYERLVKRISLLIHPALHSRPQLQKLTKWTYIGSDAFVSGALGNSWISSFETLELAEDITWQQRLHRRDVQIHHVPGPMGMRLGMLLTAIATQDELHTSQDELYRRVAMSSRAHALVKEIQTIIPGLHRFMLGETYEDLRAVASSHPVVVLVGARNRYYALIMSSSEPDGHKLLPLDINNDGVEFPPILSSSARSQSGISGTLEFGIESRTSGVTSLNDQLASLWRKIVKPVLAHLGLASAPTQIRPRLHWCPIGVFSNLPLHAAGIYVGTNKECCADFVVSSYTPTVTALLRAQRATRTVSRNDLSLALIAEDRPQETGLPVAPEMQKEIECAATIAKLNDVAVVHQQAGSTTIARTTDIMQEANIVHLACHSAHDDHNARESGFYLGDGRLTISKLKLENPFLLFHGSADSSKHDKDQPDQMTPLATYMLYSGFQNVVTTMWSMSDNDGTQVTKWFYEELLAKEVVTSDDVAYALDVALGKLRDSGVPLHRWVPFIHMGA